MYGAFNVFALLFDSSKWSWVDSLAASCWIPYFVLGVYVYNVIVSQTAKWIFRNNVTKDFYLIVLILHSLADIHINIVRVRACS